MKTELEVAYAPMQPICLQAQCYTIHLRRLKSSPILQAARNTTTAGEMGIASHMSIVPELFTLLNLMLLPW